MTETYNLPIWFPYNLSDTNQNIVLEESIWKPLIVDRVNLLSPNGIKEFKKGRYESSDEFAEKAHKEIQSHAILRLGVCMDPRLSAWFIENEGDLFEYRFIRSKWSEKVALLNFLFPPENSSSPIWLTLDDLEFDLNEDITKIINIKQETTTRLSTKSALLPSVTVKDFLGMKTVIAIDYRFASFLVKSRSAPIYKGWVIGTLDKMKGVIKHRYQEIVNDKLEEIANRVETAAGGDIKKIVNEINEKLVKLVQIKNDYNLLFGDNMKLEGTFEENVSIYPPCIQDLLNQVNIKGYIPHWERFQLGLFLKRTGMPVDDQLRYWYSKAVDNIGLSYEEFQKKAGYIIRHIYGLEGGKVDYDMPSCSTIQTKMYCTFRHSDIENINQRVQNLLKLDILHDESDTNSSDPKKEIGKKIIEASTRGLASMACAYYLELLYDVKLEKMTHPLFYLKVAGEKSGKIKKSRPDKKETLNKTDSKNGEEINE